MAMLSNIHADRQIADRPSERTKKIYSHHRERSHVRNNGFGRHHVPQRLIHQQWARTWFLIAIHRIKTTQELGFVNPSITTGRKAATGIRA